MQKESRGGLTSAGRDQRQQRSQETAVKGRVPEVTLEGGKAENSEARSFRNKVTTLGDPSRVQGDVSG